VLTWRRQLRDADDNRRARQLTDLLQALGGFSSDPGSSDAARRKLSVLAGLAVLTDPQSAAVRQVAAGLQRLADAWPDLDAAERSRRLAAVAGGVSDEARRALADPPAVIKDVAR